MGTTEAVDEIVVRPYRDGDAEFRARVVRRLHPGPTVSPRDPGALGDWIDRLGRNELELAAGSETFVAQTAGQAMGLLILHPGPTFSPATGAPTRTRLRLPKRPRVAASPAP